MKIDKIGKIDPDIAYRLEQQRLSQQAQIKQQQLRAIEQRQDELLRITKIQDSDKGQNIDEMV
jgi:hypothetical protein